MAVGDPITTQRLSQEEPHQLSKQIRLQSKFRNSPRRRQAGELYIPVMTRGNGSRVTGQPGLILALIMLTWRIW